MFTGFTAETQDFLWGIRMNNDRTWFTEHKQEYLDRVQTPMKALAEEVFADYQERHPDSGLKLRVARIYRDARRLHGKGPYKDHLWFSFVRERDGDSWQAWPGFWFEIGPETYAYGMGIYLGKPKVMEYFRRELDTKPQTMKQLTRLLDTRPEFSIDSPEYKRPKGCPPPPLDRWYNRKGLSLSCHRPWDETAYGPALAEEVKDAFEFLTPFYAYFFDLCLRAETEA